MITNWLTPHPHSFTSTVGNAFTGTSECKNFTACTSRSRQLLTNSGSSLSDDTLYPNGDLNSHFPEFESKHLSH